MSDSKYCHPGTDVLINHLEVKDNEILANLERDLTSVNIMILMISSVQGNFDLKHLQNIHYTFFYELYPFAGQIRDVAIAKSNLFCLPQYIKPMAEEIFSKLHRENCLQNLDKTTFVDRLAFYSGEINALHPFREGNGRSQRILLQELSKAAGYKLTFANMDKRILLKADIDAMNGQYDLLKKLYYAGIEAN